jgi:colanic acid/amylovoran biosynthesis glycosyltransferase
LLGSQPNPVMNILFEYCDIFCLPSITDYYPDGNVREREGIPVALMEAMSWKKPVISTVHAGIPELVENYLVMEKDVPSLKEKILFLLDNPDARIESGNANRVMIQTKFSTDNIAVLSNIFNCILHPK